VYVFLRWIGNMQQQNARMVNSTAISEQTEKSTGQRINSVFIVACSIQGETTIVQDIHIRCSRKESDGRNCSKAGTDEGCSL
jgi:hypothetical protein